MGLGAAYVAGRLSASWLYEVRASDPLILIIAVSAVFAFTLLAFLLPALRGSRKGRTLREERPMVPCDRCGRHQHPAVRENQGDDHLHVVPVGRQEGAAEHKAQGPT